MLFRKLILCRSCMLTSYYKIHSNRIKDFQLVNEEEIGLTKTKKSPKKPVQVSAELKTYLEECNVDQLIKCMPKSLFKGAKPASRLYLVDHNVSELFASLISEELLSNKSHVIETNPGLGFLTKKLLEMGVPSLNLYEKTDAFSSPNSHLISLLNSNPEKLKLQKIDFLDIWQSLLLDKHNQDKFTNEYLGDIPNSKWVSKSVAQIINVSHTKSFLSLMIHNFFNFTDIFEHGRLTFFIVVPTIVWTRLTIDQTNKKMLRFYNHQNVMIHLFFYTKILGELPRKAFLPWPSTKKKKQSITELLDMPMTIIKLEPKESVFKKIQKEELKSFWFFLKYCMRSQKHRVIMTFEKFVPGCGPRLLKHNIDICTKFKELSSNELLSLFKLYKSWPEYDEAAFFPVSLESNKLGDDKIEEEDQFQEPKSLIEENKTSSV